MNNLSYEIQVFGQEHTALAADAVCLNGGIIFIVVVLFLTFEDWFGLKIFNKRKREKENVRKETETHFRLKYNMPASA